MEIPRILYSSPFMGNYFCEIAHYNMAFVAIAKNAVTYLKSLAIYAKTLHLPRKYRYLLFLIRKKYMKWSVIVP